MFSHFISDNEVNLIGVEAAGEGVHTAKHAASLSKGRPGVLHGSLNYLLQDKHGQVELAHSISAGLDYPGVGPELSYLKHIKRLNAVAVTDQEALDACKLLSQTEGIIPALETAHAFAIFSEPHLKTVFKKNDTVIVCVSGRGDKDMETIVKHVR
jgi:tryptophan synthase beta chain